VPEKRRQKCAPLRAQVLLLSLKRLVSHCTPLAAASFAGRCTNGNSDAFEIEEISTYGRLYSLV
jgi:hypothetical protein